VCGDTVTDNLFGESCDDGDVDNTDGCLTACVLQACGDGFVLGGEACDDGNNANGDGCSAACAVEGGYDCGGAPSQCGLVADTWFVPGDFTTVENAVAAGGVNNGDIIFVTANTNNDDPDVNKNVRIVGTGQTIQGTANNSSTIRVINNSTVLIQGLTIRNSGNNQDAISVESGSLTLRGVTVNQADAFAVDQSAGTTLVIERSQIVGAADGGLVLRGAYTVESSVIRGHTGFTGVQFLAGASGTFAFNTLTGNGTGVQCNAVAATVTGSIAFGNTTNVSNVSGGACDVTGSLVGVNPTFAADGYHIEATSVAIDDAPLADCPPFDLDGDARPINALCDFGADERP
jgi:cysteine-rich repeat protein